MKIVVMGVSGCGKSTIGQLLADRLGLPFLDGDDFHSPANRTKMARGTPLNDEDRRPWLETLAREIASRPGVVVACSALKSNYRNILRTGNPGLRFVWLAGSRETILERMRQRQGHFMRPEMLASQIAALEEPTEAIKASLTDPPEEIVRSIVAELTSS